MLTFSSDESLPEIKVRVSGRNFLIHVLCETQRGIQVKILQEIEKLHLSIGNTSLLPFGTSMIYLTIAAEMNDEYDMEYKDFVENLCVAIHQIR
ncbi:hypothetical protein ACHQM5_000313 [Ranunculus cassubicifolius]